MNRDDLLKRCVDRRVAHETSVVAVSHLFYVYLLSALKKGQHVEVPNFGTFGTHIVGVKRQRRMPFFEVEKDLSEKVNERYKTLKTLLVGKYNLIPVEGEVEYTGTEPKYDPRLEHVGTETILDTGREISEEEYQSEASLGAVTPEPEYPSLRPKEVREEKRPVEPPPREEGPSEPEIAPLDERKLMPRPTFNLNDERMGDETQPAGAAPEQPAQPPPTLRDISGGEGPSPLLQIILVLIILGAITYALNYFGIIHLWGKRGPAQTTEETLPPVVQPPPQKEESITQAPPTTGESQPATGESQPSAGETPTPGQKEEVAKTPPAKEEAGTPTPTQTPPSGEIATAPPTGTGNLTVQVSSWPSRAAANRIVTQLRGSGFDAYIAEGTVKGRTWYRVRVGRFASQQDAQVAVTRLKDIYPNGLWITKVD